MSEGTGFLSGGGKKGESFGNVQFVAVARIVDRCVVASLAYNSSVDLNGVKQVLEQKMGMQAGTHYSFSTGQVSKPMNEDLHS